MGWPVILTPQAQDDLRELVIFIARDSPGRARSFANSPGRQSAFHRRASRDGPGGSRAERSCRGEIVHRSYRIIYEVLHEPNAIYILRFWHGARGTPEITDTEQ